MHSGGLRGGALLYCFTKLSLTSVIHQYASLAFSYTCSGCCCDPEINTGGAEEYALSRPELICLFRESRESLQVSAFAPGLRFNSFINIFFFFLLHSFICAWFGGCGTNL